jgi:hypothetical protein
MIGLGWATLYYTMVKKYETQKDSTSAHEEK